MVGLDHALSSFLFVSFANNIELDTNGTTVRYAGHIFLPNPNTFREKKNISNCLKTHWFVQGKEILLHAICA